jgi:hypothetical protein
MKVSEVKIGNIFEYIPVIGGESELGIRLNESEDIQLINCILDVDYCIMDQDFEVLELMSIDELKINEEELLKQKMKLSNVNNNYVFQVSGLYGLLSTYCKTNFRVLGGIICAALMTPTQMFSHIEVNDLGPTGDFNGLPDEGIRRIDISKE